MEQQKESKEADNPSELAWCLLNCHGELYVMSREDACEERSDDGASKSQ